MDFTTVISADSLRELLGGIGNTAAGSRLVVLDCRFDLNAPAAGHEAYLTAHIPGARYAGLDRDLSGPIRAGSGRHPLPAPAVLRQRFISLGIGGANGGGAGETRDTPQVVAYDEASGAFAARAWWLLRWLGHIRVAVLDGGFKAWVAGGGAVESGEPPAGPAIPATAGADATSMGAALVALDGILPAPRADMAVDSTDVLHALQDPTRLIVDARAVERFAGAVEPIDPVAGHIPGAVNHPFSSNLGADGRFLPADELRRRWQERLAGTAPANAILMCGSGVTACHNLLAMEIAGLPGGKLYAGSWSEWIHDPERPTAQGGAPT